MLERAERIAVIVAAIAALFPLYQFWSEAEMRLLERRSNYVQALALCAPLGDVVAETRKRVILDGIALGVGFDVTRVQSKYHLEPACDALVSLRTELAGRFDLTGTPIVIEGANGTPVSAVED